MPEASCAASRFSRGTLLVAGTCALLLCRIGNAFTMEVVAAQQIAPGAVEVTVRLDAVESPPRASNWVMRLDGASQVQASQLRALPADPVPSWLVLCLDRSGSLSDAAVGEIKEALSASLRRDEQGNMPYQIAVLSFATDIRRGAKFSGRYLDVDAALGDFARESNPQGRSRLYDATLGALANLRGREGGKRVILVSDGKDEGSVQGVEALKRRARDDGYAIAIDTIAYGAQSASFGGALSELAGGTGGRADAAVDAGELGKALKRMLNDVGGGATRYVVSFHYPADPQTRSAVSKIVYTPAGGASVVEAVGTPLAAPAAPAAPAARPPPDWFDRLIAFFHELPPFVKAISGLLAALTAFFAAQKTVKVIREHVQSWVLIHVLHIAPGPERPTDPKPGADMKNQQSESRRKATQINAHLWPDPSPGRPAAILRGIEGSARGRTVEVTKPIVTIGAADDNDLVLVGDDWASARHARLRVQAGSLYVDDLGSTNGSFHNDDMFKNQTTGGVGPGDTLRFGHSSFQVLEGTRRPA